MNSELFRSGLLGLTGAELELTLKTPIVSGCPLPDYCDNNPYMMEASDQLQTSECGPFAVCGFIESLNWRDRGIYKQLDPHPVYVEAKRIDGSPLTDGTTLQAAAQAAINLGLLPKETKLKILTTEEQVRRAIFHFGSCLVGYNITEGWFHVGPDGRLPAGKWKSVGGHANLACFFDKNSKGSMNSWSDRKGWRGLVRLTNEEFAQQFMYGLQIEVPR